MSNPKPTVLKEVEGTARADRVKKDEPKPDTGIPSCPDYLSEAEKAEFQSIAKVLLKMGVLTVADGLALENLAVLTCEVRDLTVLLREGRTTSVVSTQKETVDRLHPLYPMLQQSRREQRALWACFGLDPAARTKVHTVPLPPNGKASKQEVPVRSASSYLSRAS